MLQKIRTNLLLKTVLAILAAVVLIQAALLWPEASQRKRAARRQAFSAMMGAARADLGVKSEALRTGQFDRVKSRMPFWQTDRFPSATALLDASGQVKVASGDVPDFQSGAPADLLQDALEGEAIRESSDGLLFTIVPLATTGELLEGQEAIGAFVVLADEDRAISTLTQRGAFADSFLMALGALFSAALLSAIVYFLFIRPVRMMERHDRQLDLDSGRFEILEEKRLSADELGALGRARNRLLERMTQLQEQVRETSALYQRAEAKYRALVQTIPDIVFRMNAKGEFVFLSPSLERLVGLKPETVYDSKDALLEQIVPEDRAPAIETFEAILKGEKGRQLRLAMKSPRANEPPIPFSLFYTHIADAKGELQAVEGVFRRTTTSGGAPAQPPSDRFAILQDISKMLHSGPVRDDVFDYASRRAAEIAAAERAVVALVGHEECHALGLYNLPEELRLTPFPLADTAEAKVVESREPLALLTEENWTAYGLTAAYLGVPVLSQFGQPVALICCHGPKPEQNGEVVAALMLLADLILPALESERALRQAQQVEIVEEPRRKRKKGEEPTFFE